MAHTHTYTVHQKEAFLNGASRRVCPNSWASTFARGNGCESGNYWAKSCTWPKDSIKSCMRYVRQCLRLQCLRALTIANSHRVNEINAKNTSTQLNCILYTLSLSLSLSFSLHLPPSPSPRPMFVVFTGLTNQTWHSSHRKARMLQWLKYQYYILSYSYRTFLPGNLRLTWYVEYQPHRDEAEKADAEVPEIRHETNLTCLYHRYVLVWKQDHHDLVRSKQQATVCATYTEKLHNPAWAWTFDHIHWNSFPMSSHVLVGPNDGVYFGYEAAWQLLVARCCC